MRPQNLSNTLEPTYDLQVKVLVYHDVLRFQVSMHDPAFVHRLKRENHLRSITPTEGVAKGAFLTNQIAQVAILAVIENEEQRSVVHKSPHELNHERNVLQLLENRFFAHNGFLLLLVHDCLLF